MLRKVLIGIQEVLYIMAVVELGYLVYIYLASWPIYRFVSYVVIIILWSNLAVATTYVRTTRMKALSPGRGEQQQPLSTTTSTYLIALREGIFRGRQL